ncbi:uncharacterized protein FIBRA_07909 [Fibroporia radiculosa]|uniref:Uncharacterized protein n=1 Tax=Fibroporia radiculosa TaxID=599839 RepID=J4GFW4_9APHY|nr:uncharacterized protein FIBRA_07909 [Fibroporia radiculosa]CCM05678.1 predicted protein [Fibroporia radiculosa]
MVATFEWAEILAQAAADRQNGDFSSVANALLYAHTLWHKNAFRRFCSDRHLIEEKVLPGNPAWDQFTSEYEADYVASQIMESWKVEPDRYPPPAFLGDVACQVDYILPQGGTRDMNNDGSG